MKNPFKKETIYQEVCLLEKTNRVDHFKLPTDTLHMESVDTAEAWGIDSKQQCKDRETGKYIQYISSTSCDPVKIYKGSGIENVDPDLVQSQTEDQSLAFTELNKEKTGSVLWLGICLALLTLTTCIVILAVAV